MEVHAAPVSSRRQLRFCPLNPAHPPFPSLFPARAARQVLAVIHIQRAWRCHAARRGVHRAIAARRIQRATRAMLARSALAGLRAEKRAAVTLQAAQRGRRGRREAARRRHAKVVAAQVETESAAAVTLQAVQRGRADRRRAAGIRAERDERCAATAIQVRTVSPTLPFPPPHPLPLLFHTFAIAGT